MNLLSEKLFSALLRHLHEKRPETERNYKLFLSVYNFLSQRYPEILSRWRRKAYYAAWYLAEDKAMQAIMQRYLDYSKAFKKKNGFEDINICGGNENIFTIAYNLNAFLDTHIKSKILDGRNEKIAVLIKDADLNRIQNQVMLRYWSKYIEIQKEDPKTCFLNEMTRLFSVIFVGQRKFKIVRCTSNTPNVRYRKNGKNQNANHF